MDKHEDRRRDRRGTPANTHTVYLRIVDSPPQMAELENVSYRGAKLNFNNPVPACVGDRVRLLMSYTPANKSMGVHGLPAEGVVVRMEEHDRGVALAVHLRDVRELPNPDLSRFVEDITDPPPAA